MLRLTTYMAVWLLAAASLPTLGQTLPTPSPDATQQVPAPAAPPAPASAPAPTSAPASIPEAQQTAQVPAPPAPPPGSSATPGNGTQAGGVFTIRRTSRLVVLDVLVTDQQGRIVTGLTRDDFHVTEADAPQTILNFDPAGANTPASDLVINSTADLDRVAPRAPVNIILLDEFNTHFEDMAFARYSLKKYLSKQPDKLTMPTMLIAVGLEKFTVLRDYTQDKEQILSALDHHFAANPWQAQQGAWLSERYGTAFGTLMRVAEATIGHQGHKNMIWIGRGFPALNMANTSIDTEDLINSRVQQCVNMLRDARVTLYTVDPAGLQVNPYAYGLAAGLDDPFGGNYQFSRLAKATGGRTFYGRNDVDAEIGTSIRDGGSFYTLAYRPTTGSLGEQKFRRIRITFNRADLVATTREGYYLQRGAGHVDPQNPSRRLVFDLLAADSSTMVYDGVPVTLTASLTNPNAFVLHVAGSALNWSPATDTAPRSIDVMLLASSFDKQGKELKRLSKNIHAVATADVPPTGRIDRALDMSITLDHDPKAVRARFVVRINRSGRIGTADAVLGQSATATTGH